MISEAEFHVIVGEWLEARFGAENVYHEPRLRTDREPDFIVYGDLGVFAVEVENDSSDVVAGFGQAILYAAHDPRYIPVVVFPTLDDVDREEIELLRQYCIVLELDPDGSTTDYGA